jgi:hypothetical protein
MRGAHEAAFGPPRLVLRDALPAAATLVAATVLAATAALNNAALGVALLAVQTVVALAWLALTDVDGAEAATVVVVVSGAAADLLAVRRHGEGIAASVGVVALAFVAALAVQLARSHRARTAEALAGTVSGVVLAVFAAHLLSTSARTGRAVVATGVLCAAVALLAGRAGDLAAVRPALAPGARRGLLGLVLGVAAAAGAGALMGAAWAPLSAVSGTALGVATGLAAAAADLALDLMAADAGDDRRAAALRPLSVLLPLVVAAPVAYAAARLLIG